MLCDSAESHPVHIDLHRLFTARQTLNISATVKRVARGGGGEWNAEGRSKETSKKRVNKGSGVNMKRQVRQTPDWAHVDAEEEGGEKNVERERRGKQEGCCNRTHVLPGDSYPQWKLWSSLQHVCACVCVRACHSRWRLYELSHSLFMTAPRWQSQTQRTTCLQLWASQFRHRKVTRFFILLDKQCVYIRTCDLLDRWRCACSLGEHMGKKWRVRVFVFIPQVILLLEIKTKQNKKTWEKISKI